MSDFNYIGNIDLSITFESTFAIDYVYSGDVSVNISFDSSYFAGFYNGNIDVAIVPSSEFSASFSYIGNIQTIISLNSNIDGKFNYAGNIGVKASLTSVIVFNTGIPYSVQASVTIDGMSYTNDLNDIVKVSRQDNAAATFGITINSSLKPATFIDKEIKISFLVFDINGDMVSFNSVFTGKIREVEFTDDIDVLLLSGYDYSGVHNSLGELVSQDITTVLTGSVLATIVGTINTGFAPIWGVNYTGDDDIVDGRDYFVNTLTGKIEIPISSNFINTPGELAFSYMNPVASLKALIESIVAIKGWIITEDGITMADYSVTTKQPVISISNESIIDAVRKLIELSGAKLEANLFPELRIFSETVNIVGADNHVVNENTKYFEDSLIYDIDIDNLITKQTVRSVAKTFANVVISPSKEITNRSGTVTRNPILIQLIFIQETAGLILQMVAGLSAKKIAEITISKSNVFSVSHVASGTTIPFFTNYVVNLQNSDWIQTIDDNNIIYSLWMRPLIEWIPPIVFISYPGANWALQINGTFINYGEGTIEETVEVTGTRSVVGVDGELIGDVYENAYIETDTHAGNIVNAILTERGNFYRADFLMPLHESANINIGDKLNIQKSSTDKFIGIVKQLNYSLNTNTAEATTEVMAKGIGVGI